MPYGPSDTLVDLFDGALARFSERPALSIRDDDGTTTTWTYADLDRRSRLAAWRLRTLGLEPGDRVLAWGASSPAVAAAYIGAIRARLILVPLDLRMSRDAIGNIRRRTEPRHLLVGTGRDAPDPETMGIADLPMISFGDLAAEPDGSVPPHWEAEVRAWERPAPDEIWDLIFTSGTTGSPKGVMLAHDNLLETIRLCHVVAPEIDFRIVSVLPLSHLFEQAIGLFFALDVGAHILYVRIGNPRNVVDALRDHRVTAMILVPQVLDLLWSAIEREIDRSGRRSAFDRLRRIARHLPFAARRLMFRSIHARIGGDLQLFVSSGAFLPPGLQQSWEDVGVRILQGYGSTENGFGTFNTIRDHGLGTVGRPIPPVELRIADDGEVLFRGPTLFKGYWQDPEATARAIDDEGWYHSGDIGHLDPDGRLILSGRTKDRIALPNGFKVYPEDIENALRIAGLRDTVAVETRPGRIEAVVLPGVVPDTDPADFKATVDAAVRRANAALGPNQRVSGWRLWPDDDFPRTHTLKIRRDPIREWAAGEAAERSEAVAGA